MITLSQEEVMEIFKEFTSQYMNFVPLSHLFLTGQLHITGVNLQIRGNAVRSGPPRGAFRSATLTVAS